MDQRSNPVARTAKQHSNRLSALRDFFNISAHRHERLTGAFGEAWPLHFRQLIATCVDFYIPEEDRVPFLLLSLCAGAVHYFLQTVEIIKEGNRHWEGIV